MVVGQGLAGPAGRDEGWSCHLLEQAAPLIDDYPCYVCVCAWRYLYVCVCVCVCVCGGGGGGRICVCGVVAF